MWFVYSHFATHVANRKKANAPCGHYVRYSGTTSTRENVHLDHALDLRKKLECVHDFARTHLKLNSGHAENRSNLNASSHQLEHWDLVCTDQVEPKVIVKHYNEIWMAPMRSSKNWTTLSTGSVMLRTLNPRQFISIVNMYAGFGTSTYTGRGAVFWNKNAHTAECCARWRFTPKRKSCKTLNSKKKKKKKKARQCVREEMEPIRRLTGGTCRKKASELRSAITIYISRAFFIIIRRSPKRK